MMDVSKKKKMATSDDITKILADHFEQVGAIHKASGQDDLAVAHNQTSQKLRECIGATKADIADALSKTLVPDSVRGIPMADVPAQGFGITAVPRPGQQVPAGLEKSEVDAIDPRWRHLIE